jgi:hypothetical protein
MPFFLFYSCRYFFEVFLLISPLIEFFSFRFNIIFVILLTLRYWLYFNDDVMLGDEVFISLPSIFLYECCCWIPTYLIFNFIYFIYYLLSIWFVIFVTFNASRLTSRRIRVTFGVLQADRWCICPGRFLTAAMAVLPPGSKVGCHFDLFVVVFLFVLLVFIWFLFWFLFMSSSLSPVIAQFVSKLTIFFSYFILLHFARALCHFSLIGSNL